MRLNQGLEWAKQVCRPLNSSHLHLIWGIPKYVRQCGCDNEGIDFIRSILA